MQLTDNAAARVFVISHVSALLTAVSSGVCF